MFLLFEVKNLDDYFSHSCHTCHSSSSGLRNELPWNRLLQMCVRCVWTHAKNPNLFSNQFIFNFFFCIFLLSTKASSFVFFFHMQEASIDWNLNEIGHMSNPTNHRKKKKYSNIFNQKSKENLKKKTKQQLYALKRMVGQKTSLNLQRVCACLFEKDLRVPFVFIWCLLFAFVCIFAHFKLQKNWKKKKKNNNNGLFEAHERAIEQHTQNLTLKVQNAHEPGAKCVCASKLF